MNNIIFYPCRLGQKIKGVDKTAKKLFNLINGEKRIIKCERDIEINLKRLFDENIKIQGARINIGGDHSMSIATVASSLSMHKKLKVLWIDAHGDINTRYSSKSGNMHGMPLSFLTKLDKKKFMFNWPVLKFENLMYIGLRELDEFEEIIIRKNDIKLIKSDEINVYPGPSLKRIKEFIKNDPLHISFDVDALDPKYIACTGCKVYNGLELKKIRWILNSLIEENIVNMDITELNLYLGDERDKLMSVTNYIELFIKYINWKI